MIPFVQGLLQNHTAVWTSSVFIPLLADWVTLDREELRGRALVSGEAYIFYEGSCVCAIFFSLPS